MTIATPRQACARAARHLIVLSSLCLLAGAAQAASVENPPVNSMMNRAHELEANGHYAEASRLYAAASNAGHGPASYRMGELLMSDRPGVHHDYVAAVHYFGRARGQGVNYTTLEKHWAE
jgi:TPR repeat protein